MRLHDRLPSPQLPYGLAPCNCPTPVSRAAEPLRLIVLTGGPGAGKTAVLEAARQAFCKHVATIPEAASIVFGGGFPRHDSIPGARAAQRAIFHVQREGERLVDEEGMAHTALCDRGTVDGEAYWPGEPGSYWQDLGLDRTAQINRYCLVVHMRTPSPDKGYATAGLRTEDAQLAHEIDKRIANSWRGHPNVVTIPAAERFEDKMHDALDAIFKELNAR